MFAYTHVLLFRKYFSGMQLLSVIKDPSIRDGGGGGVLRALVVSEIRICQVRKPKFSEL